ncbi:MAG: hypothetical protein KGI33_07970 [Thaumarchaeota archaeon]|nr:hypothetical protein [Nitrososphaerota archaeon]
MIFSRKKQELIDPYTVEQCTSCNTLKKRKFVVGDYVFKVAGKCASCANGQMVIAKIYGEAVK